MDDAHVSCRPDQLQGEIAGVLELVKVFYGTFGIEPTFDLATRPEKYLGTAEQWDHAERALEEALRVNGLAFALSRATARLAPKIDIHIEDVLGRDWQMGYRPGRPDDAAGALRPRVRRRGQPGEAPDRDPPGDPRLVRALHRHSHRALAGAFPTWLAPVQARVLPVSAKHAEYATQVHRRLLEVAVRAELDDRSEKLGYKVREAQLQKVPYVLVVGEREAREGTASVRKRGGEDVGAMPLDQFLAEVTAEIRTRAVTSRIGSGRG